jgi:hypothetical protein
MNSKQTKRFVKSLRSIMNIAGIEAVQHYNRVRELCEHPVIGKMIAEYMPDYLESITDAVTHHRHLIGDWSDIAYVCIRRLIVRDILENNPYTPALRELQHAGLSSHVSLSLLELLIFDRGIDMTDATVLALVGVVVNKHKTLDAEQLSWVVVGALFTRSVSTD